ncbi:MAG: PulJ/GspJ family protein [Armatimonadota bacterium]
MCGTDGNNRPAPRQAGFTVVELAVAVVITSLIFAAAAALYMNGIDMMRRGEVETGAVASVRNALTIIMHDVRSAASVVPSAVIGGTSYISGADVVVLKIPSSDGTRLRFTDFDYVAYKLVDGALIQATEPAADSVRPGGVRRLIPYGVTSIGFSYFTADGNPTSNWDQVAGVEARIVVSRQAQKGTVVVSDAQRASLMNFGLSGG